MRIVTYNIHGWRTADGKPNLDGVDRRAASHRRRHHRAQRGLLPARRCRGQPAGAGRAGRSGWACTIVFGPCLRWPAAGRHARQRLRQRPAQPLAHHRQRRPSPDLQGRGPQERCLPARNSAGCWKGASCCPTGRPSPSTSTHLDHTDETRARCQLRIARTWLVRDRNRPHLVMGDFNAVSPWDWPTKPGRHCATRADRPGRQSGRRRQRPAGRRRRWRRPAMSISTARFGEPGAVTFLPSTD